MIPAVCGPAMRQSHSGTHAPDQSLQLGKAVVRGIPDSGKQRDMVSKQRDADRNKQYALQDGQKKSHDSQNNE